MQYNIASFLMKVSGEQAAVESIQKLIQYTFDASGSSIWLALTIWRVLETCPKWSKSVMPTVFVDWFIILVYPGAKVSVQTDRLGEWYFQWKVGKPFCFVCSIFTLSSSRTWSFFEGCCASVAGLWALYYGCVFLTNLYSFFETYIIHVKNCGDISGGF